MHPEQILRELDGAFEAYPVSLYTEPHHFKVADARLTVLRSPQHWVVVIEKIGYFSRLHGSEDCFQRSYTLYGNCLELGWFEKSDALWDNLSELPFDPETGTWIPTRNRFQYFWEGKWWDVYPTEQEYQEAGIDPRLLDEVDQAEWQANPESLQPVEWIRYLCYHLNHPFFASEARLREVVREAVGDPHIESALQIVLQTRDWEHPDFLNELPSQTEGFRLIAQIIATGDASLWARADRSRFNSHWRYWIEKERQERTVSELGIPDDPLKTLMAQFLQESTAESGVVVVTSLRVSEAFGELMDIPAQMALSENSEDPFWRWLVDHYGQPLAGETLGEWLSRCARARGE